MTIAEIADYLKLLGFIIEQRSDITYVTIPVSPNYSARLAEVWNGVNTVSLYCYGDCTILLDALSKSYVVIKYIEHYYAITDSNTRRDI